MTAVATAAPERTQQQQAWDIAATVCDPEIPVLTIADLGILRDVQAEGKSVRVTITPTYSGCPAMDAIRDDLKKAFAKEGYTAEVDLVLAPAWTTDWMTATGKAKLQEYGIAPPSGMAAAGGHSGPIRLKMAVKCPQCSSLNTKELTRFGSTSCKALYVCKDCLEPFDYFKVL
ncbi:phenylacetate-CoA oxygenase subunit PaaJ [Pseudarthrobacter sp. AL07]|uniref:1,2-phenylacetyl-CoA epoxidase subunit PaaD n=1 Tax=unclassified Pseudarthrobacter TaxID=2647000 RepID=UPI00249B2CF2|nr:MULTISPECIES: 1,2-phenylacetyl-CoA epoxidase subunit PaaD [unclassified Pseudarthrobacter]MDI3195987.1 phenylacetate-CoA oxygenase subunit PaaJ [Pseudarthrobacter sp. AL20]MDI3210072.1 phenylacetate-CoA oxygenase subunit PaaJ [Pseudarthrobacter sp. AL07]